MGGYGYKILFKNEWTAQLSNTNESGDSNNILLSDNRATLNNKQRDTETYGEKNVVVKTLSYLYRLILEY